MCYDDDVLSAYSDGELDPSALREIKAHIASCDRCRGVVDQYLMLGSILEKSEKSMHPEFSEAEMLVWRRVQSSVRRRSSTISFWRRKITVPVPLAAAAVCAVCILTAALVFSPAWFIPDDAPAIISQQTQAGIEEVAFSGDESLPELEKLLQFLSEQGAAIEVKIELPGSSHFEVIGEPQLMKAADYKKANTK